MAISLLEAKNFTQDKLSLAVIDEFRKDPILDKITFDNTVTPIGQTLAYVYNRVTTLPTAGFRALNTEYTPQEAKTTQQTANLKPFGGSFNVDRVIQENVKGVKNQIAFQTEQKIKATQALFADTLINGDTGVDANSFDGLDKAITGSSTEEIPDAAIDLSTPDAIEANASAFLYYLDQLLAKLDGTPSMILVNRLLKAAINGVARKSSLFTSSTVDEFGRPVTKYGGIEFVTVGDKPGTASPIIPIDGVTGLTSLYVVRMGLDGVHAASPDGDKLVHTYMPDMKLPGAVKTGEVEMIAAAVLKATRAAGKLIDIKL